jgi:hypothetical protein
MMVQWYLFISCVSSSTFPGILNVLMFHVPMLMLFLIRSFGGDCAPVAHLTPLPWCKTKGAVLVPGDDRSGMVEGKVVIACGVSWALNLAEPIPLKAVDHSRTPRY